MLQSKLTAKAKINATSIMAFLAVLLFHLVFILKNPATNNGLPLASRTLKISGGITREVKTQDSTPKQESKPIQQAERKSPVKEYAEEKSQEKFIETKENEQESDENKCIEADISETDVSLLGEEIVSSGSGNIENIQDKILRLIQEHKYYPKAARKRGLEGDVSVRFTVSPNGLLSSIEMTGSNANSLLNEAALQAVKSAFREPFTKLDEPLLMDVTIKYSLSEG